MLLSIERKEIQFTIESREGEGLLVLVESREGEGFKLNFWIGWREKGKAESRVFRNRSLPILLLWKNRRLPIRRYTLIEQLLLSFITQRTETKRSDLLDYLHLGYPLYPHYDIFFTYDFGNWRWFFTNYVMLARSRGWAGRYWFAWHRQTRHLPRLEKEDTLPLQERLWHYDAALTYDNCL